MENVVGNLEKRLLNLELSIRAGETEQAKTSAGVLAQMQASLQLKFNVPKREGEIRLQFISDDNTYEVNISPDAPIWELKLKVQQTHGLAVERQRWLFSSRIPSDTQTVRQCGVERSGFTVVLILVAASSVQLPRDDLPQRIQRLKDLRKQKSSASPRATPPADSPTEQWPVTSTPPHARASPVVLEREPPRTLSPLGTPPGTPPRDIPSPSPVAVPELVEPVGWTCGFCTSLNTPHRPGCEQCSSERPQDYRVPAGYKPTEWERRYLGEQEAEPQEDTLGVPHMDEDLQLAMLLSQQD